MWNPTPATLSTLALLLQQSNDGSRESRGQRSEARKQLEAAREQPDLVNYLVYLLVNQNGNSSEFSETVRATAGLWLKNVLVFDWFRLTPEPISYVQSQAPKGLGDPSQLIRNASSIVVTTLVGKLGLNGWPVLLPELVGAIDQSQMGAPIQEGAVSALKNICEDNASLVAQDEELVAQLVPKLIAFTKSPNPKVRSSAISCLTEFVPHGSQAFLVHIDDFLNACFALAQSDSSPETLSSICRAFKELLTVRPDKLEPHLQGVIHFSIHCLKSSEESVALEGAEFLLALAESEADEDILGPVLPIVLPVVLETMVFSDSDLFVLDSVAEDDSNEADRDQDIKPSLPKTKHAHGHKVVNKANGSNGDDDEDDGDLDDDDDDDFESSLENWNLRKCSAATLDQLAQKIPHLTLETALPLLLQRINASQEWPVRESAVLAFGAIATGVLAVGESAFVPELVPFLVELLGNEHAPIREITCWSLSRYIEEETLDWTVLQGVLSCTLDVNKRVQAAACSALSTLSESAGSQLEPYASELFQHLRLCFSKYQKNNLLSLYECVQTVATSLSPSIAANPEIVNSVMEPMISRWNEVANDDHELLALLECLSYFAIAMGSAFAPFAPPLFERSVLLVRESLVLMQRAQIDPVNVDAPEPMVVVCSLDMIDGLVQALQETGVAPLFAAQERNTQSTIAEMLLMCLSLDSLLIKQSALALLGDLAIHCFDSQLLPHLPKLVPEVLAQIDPHQIETDVYYEPIGDNSMWAMAEIAMHHEKFSLEPWFNELFQKLGTVLCSPLTHSPTLLSNATTAIGRLGLGLPNLLAPHLHMFITKWLDCIMEVEATVEKDSALQGICMAIGSNPQALTIENLQQFLKVLAAYFSASITLQQLVKKVIEGYRNLLPNFGEIVESLPSAFQQQLKASYSL